LSKLKKSRLDEHQRANLAVLESNLNTITSSFIPNLKSAYSGFTPRELQIAQLVKEGKTTKEIADLLHSSERAIEFHRDNIRDKLGLKNKRSNLRSYLLSL